MKNKARNNIKFLIITLSLALVVILNFSILSFADTLDSYVVDNAGLFSNSEINILNEAIKNSADDAPYLFILTINDAKGKTAMDYADDFHDELIDKKGFPADSALFLIDMDNRELWVSTTGTFIDKISGDNLDYLLDSAQFYAKNGSFYEAAESFVDISIGIISGSIDVERPKEDYGYYPGFPDFDEDLIVPRNPTLKDQYFLGIRLDFIIAAFFAALITFGAIVIYTFVSYKTIGKSGDANMHRARLNIRHQSDVLVGRHVVTTPIKTHTDSKGGSSHKGTGTGMSFGGSISHTSSAGRSHGGGGRGF